MLNAEEMQWIADNLFVGNKLAAGGIRTSDGLRIDLRNIKSPIIVFCSWSDNVTPPQQRLDWLLIVDHEGEIIETGQTIVYTLHQTIGHLGIFVSGKVASKEHGEFAAFMMGAVVSKEGGIRTARRISHCFVMDVPGLPNPLIITDTAVNIAPSLADKVVLYRTQSTSRAPCVFRRCA